MAEIKTTKEFEKKTRRSLDSAGEASRSALSRGGIGSSGLGGSSFSAFDAGEAGGDESVPSREAGGVLRDEIRSAREVDSNGLESRGSAAASGGLNVSLGPGAVVVNHAAKSAEDMAREIVKPLSRQLRKLGYFSS